MLVEYTIGSVSLENSDFIYTYTYIYIYTYVCVCVYDFSGEILSLHNHLNHPGTCMICQLQAGEPRKPVV